MLRRLFIFMALVAAVTGTTNCSSEPAADLNTRMWEALKGEKIATFKKLFPFTVVKGKYVARKGSGTTPDINAKSDSDTPLLYAVRNNLLIDIITFMLDMGADMNAQYGVLTPIMLATENGNVDVVRLLLERNADPDFGYPLLLAKDPDIALLLATKMHNISLMREARKFKSLAGLDEVATSIDGVLKEKEAAEKERAAEAEEVE